MTTKCAQCACKAINKATGVCQYHWAVQTWGKAWADKCHPEHANGCPTTEQRKAGE